MTNYGTTGVGERVARSTSSGALLFRRGLGAWVDFIALAVLLFLPAFAVNWSGTAGQGLVAVLGLTGLSLVVMYFPISEGLWGRSAGKLMFGTIVVDDKGRPPGLSKAAIRTLARLVEVNPFLLGGLPAGLVSMNTKTHQRIGDLWAGTYVVPLRELRQAQRQPDADFGAAAQHFT